MRKRPIEVAVVSVVYIAAGLMGLAYHLSEWTYPHPFTSAIFWVSLVRLLAIVSGAFMLRGANWARWLAVLWMGFHVVVSAFHTLAECLIHVLFLVAIGFILFRRRGREFFARR